MTAERDAVRVVDGGGEQGALTAGHLMGQRSTEQPVERVPGGVGGNRRRGRVVRCVSVERALQVTIMKNRWA